ncbi:M23 family metallopeptidase [Paenibacillus xanthanilyticus]|uniref:M23 family metallopeptidase n=1 Tax=Paenibacillus xanthanilyticus TaxID=1783531 RepID=A0ABV8K8G6_9BACL
MKSNRLLRLSAALCALCLLPLTNDQAWAGEAKPQMKLAADERYVSAKVPAHSGGVAQEAADPFEKRRELYEWMGATTHIPWYRLAAIDQYERTITKARPKSRGQLGQWIGIYMSDEDWAGALNPNLEDELPGTIRWFNGLGKDGDGDGLAKRTSDADLLYAVASHMMQFGPSNDDFAIACWQFYHNTRAVQRIGQFAKIYETYGKLDLEGHAFPLPIGSHYSYRGTWGTKRSWGGYRIHEGTDIFADYGLPVRSTTYGIVETKGWNPYGGWRIGVRDLNNIYHYYAHLSGYDKTVQVGTVVKPGQTLGWVGSSGYGKPGTSGKFPPHLHYGVYRDRGLIEWSFDPYPLLHRWEKEEARRLRKKK